MIILSLVERDPEAVMRLLVAPPDGADALEVRLDALRRREPSAWFPGSAGCARPAIATCRRAADGGSFRGGEPARREALLAAARAGVAYVDVEFGTSAAAILSAAAPAKGILSHHDRRGTPRAADLLSLYRRMAAVPGVSVVKIVTTARDPADILEIRRLLQRTRGARIPLIAFAMGEPGIASRILAPSWGAWATYACVSRGREAAPGQITLREARETYRVAEIDEETILTGITGYPIGHSLSPAMHNTAYRHAGINFRYIPLPARRAEHLPGLIRALRVRGLSVTAPHKIALAKRVRRIEPRAREIGAVNTIVHDGRALIGFNTDPEGLMTPLRERTDPAGKIAVVLGAGGAARASAIGLHRAGARVVIASRRERPGRELARLVGGRWIPLRRLTREPYDILVNATPVGLRGRATPVPPSALRGSLVVDLVYRPPVTPLVREAIARGIQAFGGHEVLLAQGVAQYAIFTGRVAPAEVMRECLFRALSGAADEGA